MTARDLEIPAADGFPLAATLYEPAVDPGAARPAVLLNSATAVGRGYYAKFAAYLAQRGFQVLTFDYRGIGGSRPPNQAGPAPRMEDWALKDASGAFAWLREQAPHGPWLLVGHSFGGQALGLVRGAEDLGGAFLVASQSGYWRHWPAWSRPGMWLMWYLVIPVLTRFFGRLPSWTFGATEDLPAGVARQWARWGRHPRYILDGSPDERPTWKERYASLEFPILAVSLADDLYAPAPAVDALLGFYSSARASRRHLRPADYGVRKIGHFGFFRERFRDTLWAEAAAWLEERAAEALSSPARPGPTPDPARTGAGTPD